MPHCNSIALLIDRIVSSMFFFRSMGSVYHPNRVQLSSFIDALRVSIGRVQGLLDLLAWQPFLLWNDEITDDSEDRNCPEDHHSLGDNVR